MAAQPKSDAMLTIPETAERLRCSENHVYRLIASGDLSCTDIAQRGSRQPKTRVPETAITAFINARTTNARRLRATG